MQKRARLIPFHVASLFLFLSLFLLFWRFAFQIFAEAFSGLNTLAVEALEGELVFNFSSRAAKAARGTRKGKAGDGEMQVAVAQEEGDGFNH